MSIHRKVSRVGGSYAVIVPRDLAESMGVEENSPVRMTLVGRQLVIEPEDDTVDDTTFRKAFAIVLRKYSSTFANLAKFDQDR